MISQHGFCELLQWRGFQGSRASKFPRKRPMPSRNSVHSVPYSVVGGRGDTRGKHNCEARGTANTGGRTAATGVVGKSTYKTIAVIIEIPETVVDVTVKVPPLVRGPGPNHVVVCSKHPMREAKESTAVPPIGAQPLELELGGRRVYNAPNFRRRRTSFFISSRSMCPFLSVSTRSNSCHTRQVRCRGHQIPCAAVCSRRYLAHLRDTLLR